MIKSLSYSQEKASINTLNPNFYLTHPLVSHQTFIRIRGGVPNLSLGTSDVGNALKNVSWIYQVNQSPIFQTSIH